MQRNDRTRQYGKTLAQIKGDHVARYQFAANYVDGKKVLDLACGCGYGSWILHHSGGEVTGIDICQEAIDYANANYSGPDYICQGAEEARGAFDVLVTLETLEHLDDPLVILGVDAPLVIASVPNQEQYPFHPSTFAGDEYPHKRHYTPAEFEDLLKSAGFTVKERFSQTKHGEITEGTSGRFLIYIANR